jgi:hypothetical protein
VSAGFGVRVARWRPIALAATGRDDGAREFHRMFAAFAIDAGGNRVRRKILVNLATDPALCQSPDDSGAVNMHDNAAHDEPSEVAEYQGQNFPPGKMEQSSVYGKRQMAGAAIAVAGT